MASASVPRYFMIWRLNSMVRMPMATSEKKDEKPDKDSGVSACHLIRLVISNE